VGICHWFKGSTREEWPVTEGNNITTQHNTTIIITTTIIIIIIMEASQGESSSRQRLNWDVVLVEVEATCMPSGTCGHPPVTMSPADTLSQFTAVVDLSVAIVLTRSDIRSLTHHRSTQPCAM